METKPLRIATGLLRRGTVYAALVAILSGCATTSSSKPPKVAFKEPQQVKVSGIQNLSPDEQSPIQTTGVNPGDIEPIAQRMVRSILSAPRITAVSVAAPGGPIRVKGVPRIVLRPIKNASSERFDTQIITQRVRTELIKNANGQLEFIYREQGAKSADVDGAITAEKALRDSGQVDASTGQQQKTADFFLSGDITEMVTVTPGGRDRLMLFSFRLVDTNTSSIAWADDYQVRRASLLSTSYRGIDK